MTGFCNRHIRERTKPELEARRAQLAAKAALTPGLAAEAQRIDARLAELGGPKEQVHNLFRALGALDEDTSAK